MLVNNSYTARHVNLKKGLAANDRWRTDGRRTWFPHKMSFLYFVKNAWKFEVTPFPQKILQIFARYSNNGHGILYILKNTFTFW
jgi:hypothetical protein